MTIKEATEALQKNSKVEYVGNVEGLNGVFLVNGYQLVKKDSRKIYSIGITSVRYPNAMYWVDAEDIKLVS